MVPLLYEVEVVFALFCYRLSLLLFFVCFVVELEDARDHLGVALGARVAVVIVVVVVVVVVVVFRRRRCRRRRFCRRTRTTR